VSLNSSSLDKIATQDCDYSDHYLFHEGQLVGMDEADPNNGRLSISSPVGKAILGHGLNEKIEAKTPAGVSRYQIVKIEW